MRDERDVRVRARDSGLRRLKTLTGAVAIGTAAAAALFAGLAAQTTAARKLVRAHLRTTPGVMTRRSARTEPKRIPPPPPLPSLASNAAPAPAPAPAAPAQPPTPAAAPPLVVSGGS
jgi:hypothetical protein